MSMKIAGSALACTLVMTGVAQAQWFGPTWQTNTTLTAQDMEIIRNTLQRDIHGQRADTVATWQNQASGNSGTITLLRKFSRKGKLCEEIDYRIASAQSPNRWDQYVFTSCRQPDGGWKLEG